MPIDDVAIRLVIFLSEEDRHHPRGLHEVLLTRARDMGIVGATVWRGIEGFGSSRRVRTARFPDSNIGLPLAVELIDEAGQIEKFLAVVSELAPGSFVTRETVQIVRSHSRVSE